MSPDRNSGGHQPSERRIGKFFGFAPGFRSRRARNHASLSSGAQEVAKLDLPKIPHHTAVFTEPVETTAFVFLPDRTRSFLSRDEYKGVRPAEIDAPGVSPGVIFLTADMKVPSEGSVKMLEFNGIGSQLNAYPEGGQQAAAGRIYQVLESLDIPVYAVARPSIPGFGFGLSSTLIGTDVEEGMRHGITYEVPEQAFASFTPEDNQRLTDLRYADGVLWRQYHGDNVGYKLDHSRFVAINPRELQNLLYSKVFFHEVFERAEMSHLRPRTWILPRQGIVEATRTIQDSADPDIDNFVLKALGLSGGQGIVPIARDDLGSRVQHIFEDPWETRALPGKDPEGWLRAATVPFLLEEGIKSKPVVSEKDGQEYDGTLRIAFMGVTNQGKMALIPICSYWKLPSEPIGQDWNTASVVSDVHQENPSAKVSREDFTRAFTDLTGAIPAVLRNSA